MYGFLEKHKVTFLKFAFIGFFATILNYTIFLFLLQVIGFYYLISSAIGYISGVILGFFLNRRYTFNSKVKRYTIDALKYFVLYKQNNHADLSMQH